MWITIEGRLRVIIQWFVYRKRPGGRHDLPEHSFEHSNMHTSRRPASLMLTGLHAPESPVEPTGPDDTGSSTHSCILGQLSNGMQRGPVHLAQYENLDVLVERRLRDLRHIRREKLNKYADLLY